MPAGSRRARLAGPPCRRFISASPRPADDVQVRACLGSHQGRVGRMRSVQPIRSHQRQPVTALRQVAAMTAVGGLAACLGPAPKSSGAGPTTIRPVIPTYLTSPQQALGTLNLAQSYTIFYPAVARALPLPPA